MLISYNSRAVLRDRCDGCTAETLYCRLGIILARLFMLLLESRESYKDALFALRDILPGFTLMGLHTLIIYRNRDRLSYNFVLILACSSNCR